MSASLDYSHLQPALTLSREIVYKDCFSHLSHTPINPNSPCTSISNIALIKITSITCPTTSNSLDLFAPTLYALWSLNITLCSILHISYGEMVTYLGVSSPHGPLLARDILIQGLTLAYPSMVFECITGNQVDELLTHILFSSQGLNAISSATLIPTISPNASCNSSPLAPFLESMKDSCYTLVFLATSLSHSTYQYLFQEKLQTLYNTLFPFRELNHTTQCHVTNTLNESTSCSDTENQNTTQTELKEVNCSESTSHAHSKSLTLTGDPTKQLKFTHNSTQNNSLSDAHSSKSADSDSCSNQNSRTETRNRAKTHTTLDIHLTNYRTQNIKATTILTQIERLLTRYEQTANLPIFNFNTYFLSDSPAASIRAAASYINLLESKTDPLYPSFMNTWLKPNSSFDCLLTSLSRFDPPVFCPPHSLNKITPALPVTSLELGALLTPPIFSNTTPNKTPSV